MEPEKKGPTLNADDHKDPKIKAPKREGFSESWVYIYPKKRALLRSVSLDRNLFGGFPKLGVPSWGSIQ